MKRTLYFGNPAYLKTNNEQLVIEMQDSGERKTTPIEDIGMLILDHAQITITQSLLHKLLANNTALITCDSTHHPVGLFLNLDGHTLQSQKFQSQINATVPLKKQLWQQTVIAKITNQGNLLKKQQEDYQMLLNYAKDVKSGDSENHEAMAAAYYWKRIFPDFLDFKRDRIGAPPNNLLNYGYAILRALTARCLTVAGLLPTLGIHHRNQYNAYCLADDIMEPYRPYVDKLVCDIIRQNGKFLEMTPSMKKLLLSFPVLDVRMEDQNCTLMNAVQRSANSLARCFEGSSRKLVFPVLE